MEKGKLYLVATPIGNLNWLEKRKEVLSWELLIEKKIEGSFFVDISKF